MGTTHSSSPASVADALFPRTRQAVLAVLFGRPDERFYLNDIVRRARSGVGQVQRELERMTASGLILREPEANQVYFRANLAGAVYHELVTLVARTFGIADVVKAALADVRGAIDVAFIYGSVARAEQRATSDVDVLFIGDVLLSELDPALGRAEKQLGRTISPTLLDVESFRRRLADDEHFLKSVLAGPKIFVVGDAKRLKQIDGRRAR
jgi:predicted nucleotidyltransferase